MKTWLLVALAVGGAVLVVGLRSLVRARVTRWMAERTGRTAAQGRSRALVWHGGMALAAVVVLLGGLGAARAGGSVALLRYPAALLVVFGYGPVATVGSPKLTKWQKNFGQRLIESGAAREAAFANAHVARLGSAVAVVVLLAAFLLLSYHA